MWVQRLLCERGGRELASLRREELVRRGPEQDAGGGAAPREAGRSVPHPGKQQEGLLRLLCGVSTHRKTFRDIFTLPTVPNTAARSVGIKALKLAITNIQRPVRLSKINLS